jgi:hypothetical protein
VFLSQRTSVTAFNDGFTKWLKRTETRNCQQTYIYIKKKPNVCNVFSISMCQLTHWPKALRLHYVPPDLKLRN